jgi:hypothetical protein
MGAQNICRGVTEAVAAGEEIVVAAVDVAQDNLCDEVEEGTFPMILVNSVADPSEAGQILYA